MQEGAYLYAFLKMSKKPALAITIILIFILSSVILLYYLIEQYDFVYCYSIFDIILIVVAIFLFTQIKREKEMPR